MSVPFPAGELGEAQTAATSPGPGLDKLVRLGVMAEMLLAKARRAPLD